MTDISKHKKLVGLGLDLYAVGGQMEAARTRVASLVSRGYAYDSREVTADCALFRSCNDQFAALERQYRTLAGELRGRHGQ